MDTIRSIRWHPHTTAFIVAGAFVLVIASAVTAIVSASQSLIDVTLGSGQYQLRYADTDETRQKGLSGVEKLRPNGGLLMSFQEDGYWSIWMKDMKVPIDAVWLDESRQVVGIEQNLLPELGTGKTFTPSAPARYIIELPAGSVRQAGIREGVVADFTIEGEK